VLKDTAMSEMGSANLKTCSQTPVYEFQDLTVQSLDPLYTLPASVA